MGPRWLVAAILAACVAALFFRVRRDAFARPRVQQGAWLVAASWVLAVALLAVNFAWMWRVPRPPAWAEAAGCAGCASGVALWMWGRWVLAANFAQVPLVREGHRLVTGGPFRIVRNPLYLGNVLSLVSHSVAAGVYASLVLAAGVVVLCLVRIRIEERLLQNEFGKEFDDYAARTARLVPGLY